MKNPFLQTSDVSFDKLRFSALNRNKMPYATKILGVQFYKHVLVLLFDLFLRRKSCLHQQRNRRGKCHFKIAINSRPVPRIS